MRDNRYDVLHSVCIGNGNGNGGHVISCDVSIYDDDGNVDSGNIRCDIPVLYEQLPHEAQT